MVELIVAIAVILTAVLAMAYTATLGFSGIALARQRDGANGIANQMMEQIRGLAFDTVRKGLSTSDLTGDPNIVSCHSGAKCYQYGTLAEQIPTSNYAVGTTITPLVPHIRTIVSGPNTYTVSSYVTYYQDNATQNSTFRAIVTVQWANPAVRAASSRVENQTVLYSGNGCLSTATHPFAAPCQPFFYATASRTAGHVDVTGNLPDADFARATLWASDIVSTMQIEQVNSVLGNTQASGVSILPADSTEVYSNRVQVSSAADNDPAQSDPDYSTTSLPNSSSKTQTFNGSTGSLWVTSRSGDAGTTISTVTANTSPHPCMGENDNQPCGSSSAFPGQNGTQKIMSANLDVSAGDTDLGTAVLASSGSPSSQYQVFTDRNITSGATRCVGTSGDGCIHAEGTLNIGSYAIGGLPASMPAGSIPAAWQGYFLQVSSYTTTTKAEAGKSTAAPSVTATGTISYWNGNGYSTITVAPGASVPIAAAPLSITTTVNSQTLSVSLSGSALKTGGTQTTDPANCGSACTRNSADAVANSPATGDVLYTITYGGRILADLDIHIDMGSLESHVQYQPSPSG